MSQPTLFGDQVHRPEVFDPEAAAMQAALLEQAYAPIPSQWSHSDYEALFKMFGEFRALVDDYEKVNGIDVAAAITFKTTKDDRGDYYFKRRRRGDSNPLLEDRGIGTDDKDVLHFGPLTIVRAEDAFGILPDTMRTFFDCGDELFEEMRRMGRIAIGRLGMEDIFFSPNRMVDPHPVRIQTYIGTQAPHLGEEHFDRAAFTIDGDNSGSGLKGVGGQNGYLTPIPGIAHYLDLLRQNMIAIPNVDRQANFSLGAGYNHLPSLIRKLLPDFPLLAHGIGNDQPMTERNSAIGFFSPPEGRIDYVAPEKHETGFGDIQQYYGQLDLDLTGVFSELAQVA